MTEDRTLTLVSKKLLPITLALVGGVLLTACSSKPSPWSESSSPWDSREQTAGAEPSELDEIQPVSLDAEPMGLAAMEEEIVPMEEVAPVMEEPVMMEPVQEEIMPMSAGSSLAEVPASHFAVQVVASSTMENLTAFANQYQLSDQWVAETTVEGRVWYVLMLGVYPSKVEAEQALGSVQSMETQPWIRTVGSLQAVMN